MPGSSGFPGLELSSSLRLIEDFHCRRAGGRGACLSAGLAGGRLARPAGRPEKPPCRPGLTPMTVTVGGYIGDDGEKGAEHQ